jgi:tetratricopeptide (TPR) repeat protein
MSFDKILKYFDHKGIDGEGKICTLPQEYRDSLCLIKCKKCSNYDISFSLDENFANKCDLCENYFCKQCKERTKFHSPTDKVVCEFCIDDFEKQIPYFSLLKNITRYFPLNDAKKIYEDAIKCNNPINIHHNNDELFMACCKSDNLEAANWLFDLMKKNNSLIDFYKNDYEYFKIACNSRSIKMAKWFCQMNPILHIGNRKTNGVIHIEYIIKEIIDKIYDDEDEIMKIFEIAKYHEQYENYEQMKRLYNICANSGDLSAMTSLLRYYKNIEKDEQALMECYNKFYDILNTDTIALITIGDFYKENKNFKKMKEFYLKALKELMEILFSVTNNATKVTIKTEILELAVFVSFADIMHFCHIMDNHAEDNEKIEQCFSKFGINSPDNMCIICRTNTERIINLSCVVNGKTHDHCYCINCFHSWYKNNDLKCCLCQNAFTFSNIVLLKNSTS